MIKLTSKKNEFITWLKDNVASAWSKYAAVNILIFAGQVYYLARRFIYINTEIPFYYFRHWGENQLGPKSLLHTIPIIVISLSLAGFFLAYKAKQAYFQYLDKVILTLVTAGNLLLSYSLIRIVLIASVPFEPLINPEFAKLLLPFSLGLVTAYVITPVFISLFEKIGLVTVPMVHKHPGMSLTQASTRGGGIIFMLVFVALTPLFTNLSSITRGIIVSIIFLGILGLMDDYQNTRKHTVLKLLENPIVRLGVLFFITLIPVYMGLKIESVGNPFTGNAFDISRYTLGFFQNIRWLSYILTTIWIVWILNGLSWSNGVDGQYGGFMGVAFLTVLFLALRFDPIQPEFRNAANMAAIASGISFGITNYNWFPSRIMWGFGAVTAGLVLAATSIMAGGKITISVLIILIPFMDAAVTVTRRIVQRKNPFKGDRGHLHHFLLKKGWGVRRVAVFYWATTALFGTISILTADKDIALTLLFTIGLLGSVIMLVRNSELPKNTKPNVK